MRVEEGIDNSGLIFKSNFPENSSDFLALRDDNWILGTYDGTFYKSNDKGKTWQKKGEMKEKDKINAFYRFSEKIGNEEKKYLLAGTEKGIYMSKDEGETWNEVYSNNAETGKYVSVNYFSHYYDRFLNKLTITGYGWDGENSQFSTIDGGQYWKGEKVFNGRQISAVSYTYSWSEDGAAHKIWAVYYGLSGPDKSVIATEYGKDFFICEGEGFNFFALGSSGECYAGTKNGLYANFASGTKSWHVIGLKDQNVKSLFQFSNRVFYACTDSALHYSTDCGYNWEKIMVTAEPVSMNKILTNGNKVYFLTRSSGVYYAELPKVAGGTLFNPIMLYPADNSEPIDTDITFKWDMFDKYHPSNYILQVSKSADFNANDTETRYLTAVQSYKMTGMTKNIKYYWRMRAYSLTGSTNWTQAFTFRIK